MKLPTYPARPISGGSFLKARPRVGAWSYEPKYNGWRALVHIASGMMFNRHGERLSIRTEFDEALTLLRSTLDAEAFKWADVEALERRHDIGRGCLIVLDVIPEPPYQDATYAERRQWIVPVLPELSLVPPWGACSGEPFPLVSVPSLIAGSEQTWSHLQQVNKLLSCQFYEGFVAKRADSVYPIQLHSPHQEYPFWVKHRWQW